MRLFIVISSLEVVPIPGDKITDTDLARSRRCKSGVAHDSYCKISAKTIPKRLNSAPRDRSRLSSHTLTYASERRRTLLSTTKIMISAALLYLALRKVDLFKLFSRFTLTSLFWIDMAIAVKFLQTSLASCAGARSARSAVPPVELGGHALQRDRDIHQPCPPRSAATPCGSRAASP
jgi:hypothetical protein